MLEVEITDAQRSVVTDAYQMSIGEIVNMYQDKEIVIAPEFQRLFRWEIGQKSKLIESLLLGIPLPSIFVFEREDGKWELIDGLQRLSTILEFMGMLKFPDGNIAKPSILEATKYLPSLHNVVWEPSELISDVPLDDQIPLDNSRRLAIKRSRISVEILKRTSDQKTKFDLFQRLNSGGTVANEQEVRNCMMLMINPEYFRAIKDSAEQDSFLKVVSVSEDQKEKQRHLEIAVRFIVHTLREYDGKLDVNEFIDENIISLIDGEDGSGAAKLIDDTFTLLNEVAGEQTLRRYNAESSSFQGRVTLTAIEAIAVGVARNFDAISALSNPKEFVEQRVMEFWQQPEVTDFTTPGLRGTVRIKRTIPFGTSWFRP